ncbi:hypothetical protein BDV19DRAFT_364192 [Aspergillus venezuelensis]
MMHLVFLLFFQYGTKPNRNGAAIRYYGSGKIRRPVSQALISTIEFMARYIFFPIPFATFFDPNRLGALPSASFRCGPEPTGHHHLLCVFLSCARPGPLSREPPPLVPTASANVFTAAIALLAVLFCARSCGDRASSSS